MNHRRAALIVLAGISFAAGTAIAADIYRFVDADGNVNYVDRPSGAATEERLAIVSKRSDIGQSQARTSTPEDAEADAPPSSEDTARPKKKTRAEIRAAEREREQQCQTYRGQMETLATARRVYREDDDGERVYLDESELQAARDQAQSLIEEFCR